MKTYNERIEELENRGYIVESGSNDNGSYIKYSDGTMIQYGKIQNTSSGKPTITFPVTFATSTYNVQLTNMYYSGGGTDDTKVLLTVQQNSLSSCDVYFRNYAGTVLTDTSMLANWQAIGKWK